MDDLSALLFLVVSISLLGGAVWLMVSAANSRPVRDFNAGRLTGTWSTQVVKPVHPEMKDVEPGEQLLGVTFQEKPNSCDLEEYKELQARIDALRAELEGEDEEDDDDGGGDVVISRK